MMKNSENLTRFVYWLSKDTFKQVTEELKSAGTSATPALLTPCQALRASADAAVYVAPAVWSRVCRRQGSWYRSSDRKGKYMLVSGVRLHKKYDRYLDVSIRESDFLPDHLPDDKGLQDLVSSPAYHEHKPHDWENKTVLDSIMFKTLFTLTGFWGIGDNLKRYWTSHKANHANYLSQHYTTELDGEQVPYSVADNAGICSSCVEFFNVMENRGRKLVRACPGSVTFGGAKAKVYYDVKPVTFSNA